MKQFKTIYRNALFLYLTDPLFYLTSFFTVLFCAFRFFFAEHFFITGAGSTDLRPLFSTLPYISIIVIPMLVMRLRSILFDESLPVTPLCRNTALTTASLTAFFFPVILLITIPICVSAFGTVSMGQIITGFTGILFYGMAACALSIFIGSFFSFSSVVPFLLTALILALVDSIHLLPLSLPVSTTAAHLLQKISFAWHFDAAGKGILDTRDLVFYLTISLIFLTFSVFFDYCRTGFHINKITLFYSLFFFILLFTVNEKIFIRLDLTDAHQFSVSQTSKTILDGIKEPLRITYFRSEELSNLYPQSNDVADYLSDYCSQNNEMALRLEKADPEKLSSLGIQGQQMQRTSDTKTELVTVYSAVLIEYLGKQEIIPFVLSTETLEYDLTRNIQHLVSGTIRPVTIVIGNGLSADSDYSYVQPWLVSRGFTVSQQTPAEFEKQTNSVTAKNELLILGSSKFTEKQSAAIESAVKSGMSTFIATSPYTVALTDDWSVSRTQHDTLIPVLNAWGFSFNHSLISDISCLPLTLAVDNTNTSDKNATSQQTTLNYPLWLSILPQENAPQGITLFWTSPLVLYGTCKPLFLTTRAAWELAESTKNNEEPFVSNPFLVAKSASAAGTENKILIPGATVSGELSGYYTTGKGSNTHVTVVSDQYFVDSLITGYISSSSQGDFRNYDFLASELLRLRGDTKLAVLMNKKQPQTMLYKITDSDQFNKTRKNTIFTIFILLQLLIIFIGITSTICRYSSLKKLNGKYF